jgi:two-component sensor histidine kinase
VPFFTLVHVGITRQLNRLSAAVGALAPAGRAVDASDARAVDAVGPSPGGGQTQRIALPRRKIFAADDEFDELVATFNALLADIRDERRIRTDRENALERALKRSEFLLREVHHRVKNNLQMLISMFSLHAERLREPERSVMLDAERRIRSLALVHVQLYQDENITSVEVVTYTGALLNSLTAAARGHDGAAVGLSVRGEPVDVPLDKAIPLALVLNELGTNAIKHAFASREAGEITVDIERHDDTLVVALSDNGCGVGPDFSIDGSANFGLTIVATLLEQIDARLRHERPATGGTRFVVTVPL